MKLSALYQLMDVESVTPAKKLSPNLSSIRPFKIKPFLLDGTKYDLAMVTSGMWTMTAEQGFRGSGNQFNLLALDLEEQFSVAQIVIQAANHRHVISQLVDDCEICNMKDLYF